MYYLYFHIDPITTKIFYIGKGKGKRAWCKSKVGRNLHHYRKLNKLIEYGYKMDDIVYIVERNIDEQYAFEKEKKLIDLFGKQINGGTLLNISDGGEGGLNGESNHNFNRQISESILIDLLKNGLTVNLIANKVNMDQNSIKKRFYPDQTLREYCVCNEISYPNSQSKEKNGNYKEFDSIYFIQLVKENLKLCEVAYKMNVSSRWLIKQYREQLGIRNWIDVKRKFRV